LMMMMMMMMMMLMMNYVDRREIRRGNRIWKAKGKNLSQYSLKVMRFQSVTKTVTL